MPKKLLNFKGLYGDQREPFSGAFIHHESLQARSERHNWGIHEHLHAELFQIFILTSGSGMLFSGAKKIALQAPCILHIPNSTLHGFVFQSDIAGDVLTFSELFLEEMFNKTAHILLDLHHLNTFSFEAQAGEFEEINFLKDKLINELKTEKPEKKRMVQLIFEVFLIALHRVRVGSAPQLFKSDKDKRTLSYFHAFQKLVRQGARGSKTIREYAKDLNITPVHLNRICQAVAQKSALQLLHDYRIREAQKYLSGTSHSISEISYFLDFKDPAHFSKLFKKRTGLTPGDFRKQNPV